MMDQPLLRAPPPPRRRALPLAVCAACGLAVVALARSKGGGAATADAAAAAPSALAARITRSSDLSLYKRTHASIDAEGDARFLRAHFGLNVTINETVVAEASGALCAKRFEVATLSAYDPDGAASNPFTIHFFESHTTPEGARPVAAWVAYWEALHGGFANRTGARAWDEFLHNSMTFYVPDLTPFVRGLRGAGVPMLTASYEVEQLATTTQGAPGGDAKVSLYSATVIVPGTGHAFELVSEGLEKALRGPFGDLPATACAGALKLSLSAQEMRALWRESGGRMDGGVGGLPDLLLVKLSFPGEPAKLATFVHAVAGDFDVAVTQRTSGAGTAAACSYAGVKVDYIAELRAVDNPAARADDGWTAADYADYVEAVHAKWTGSARGYDRWLDSHFGLQLDGATSLDALVEPLEANGIAYAARKGAQLVGGADDSLWTGGVSGQGFEFHGTIDFSALSRNTSGMDYCASPTSPAAAAARR